MDHLTSRLMVRDEVHPNQSLDAAARERRRSPEARLDRRTLRAARNQAIDVVEAERPDDAVDQDEQHQGRHHGAGRERRYRVALFAEGPGVTQGFATPGRSVTIAAEITATKPSHQACCAGQRYHRGTVKQLAAPPQHHADEGGEDHQQADPT